jgi:hypothetical protein
MEEELQLKINESSAFSYIPQKAQQYFYSPALQHKSFTLEKIQEIFPLLKEHNCWDQILSFFIFYRELDLLTEPKLHQLLSLYEPFLSTNTVWTQFLTRIKIDGIALCAINYREFYQIYCDSYLKSIHPYNWDNLIYDIGMKTKQVLSSSSYKK